ncbi:MAG: class I adenylate-forming enzyme family protein [Acidimicrobiales bacterium]
MKPAWARHLPVGMRPEDVDLLGGGTLPAEWARRWAERPDAPVVHSHETGWVTAAELRDRVGRAAGGLRELGLRAGDRLLVSASASVDLIALHAGALANRLVVVPANTAYTATELAHVAADSVARAAVLEDAERGGALRNLPVVPVTIDGPAAEAEPPVGDDPALVCYTSGTTGRPKGAVLSHANLLASAEAVRLAWRWTQEDRLVLALPLFHMHGLGVGVHGTLLAGASMILLPRFDADAVLDAARVHDASMFFGVPTMYARLADATRLAELGRLRLCVSGSAPLSGELHERIVAGSGQHVLERYGMTETAMLVSNPVEGERRAGSVGFPLPGVELRLDPATEEILVRGPNVFRGYWRNLVATAESFEDGWFRTGDVGSIDSDGYLHIVGRIKELIITGGFNVYPREVEEALLDHPCVGDAAVAGTPDATWGEVVVAYVVASGPVTEDELLVHCGARLAPYKRPRRVHFVATIPRNALGKIDRPALVLTSPPD